MIDTTGWPGITLPNESEDTDHRVARVVEDEDGAKRAIVPITPQNADICEGCLSRTDENFGCETLPNCAYVVWVDATPDNYATYLAERMTR